MNFYFLIIYYCNHTFYFLGIGIQGLADAFLLMRYPFESKEAQKFNIQIFETLYYGALEASCELAEIDGPYETYEGCPVSKGVRIYVLINLNIHTQYNYF